MARFFLGLDGVLADFNAGCARALGSSPKDFIEAHGERVFWKRIAAVPGFYSDLGWIAGAGAMLTAIRDVAESHGDMVMILTGLPEGDWAAPQKRAWVAWETASLPVVCCLARDKAKYCNPGDLLLDARPEVAVPWREAGGVFFLHEDPVASAAAVVAHYG